ncbi:MAG: integrase core domain-containing protein [Thermoguttaceae bacterium]|jgi:transposase InsO family protein
MNFVLHPWQLLLVTIAGWVNQQQQQIINFQRTEIEVLKEKLGKKRRILNDNQRRRLAVKGKVLGRKVLEEIGALFTPDTILRWYRQLVAAKWDYSQRREKKPGRPSTPEEITTMVLQMARENPSWGYDRIVGALANLGHEISDQTVGNILKAHGIEPAPERKHQTTWKTFLKAHWDVLGAIDFTTIEVWTKGGLVTFYLLFVMELATRRIHFAGCTPNPHDLWMMQIARNLTDAVDGFLKGKRYLLMDRDGKFSPAFRAILKSDGVESLLLPARSPNLNAHLERFNRSLKEECLDRMIFFGESSLRNAVREFLVHYHAERNHQGMGNRILVPGDEVGRANGDVECTERLGGLLRYYHREAA